jgi:tetratricopeptide (TPR) repeat protein
VHMPAHVYIRTGDYDGAVRTNERAALADQAYIRNTGAQGMYPMMYYSHNLHFIAICAAMSGNYLEARKGATMLAANVGPHLKEIPPLEAFMTVPLAVDIRFHKWNEILKTPKPDVTMQTLNVFWHFARGSALAGTGKLDDAQAEYQIVADAESKTPPDLVFAMPVDNKTKDILKIAENVLAARIALAKKDHPAALEHLRAAIAIQDTLNYDEPPDWFYPVRESLGAALLMTGDNAGAEQVFRDDLDRNPRNPRSLFGLEQALKAQGRDYDAGFVHNQFKASWKGGATPLTIEDLV